MSQEFQLSCPQTHLGGFFDVAPEGLTLLWKPEGDPPSPPPHTELLFSTATQAS